MNTTTCTRCQNPTPDCICPELYADADALEARGEATWQKRRRAPRKKKDGDELELRIRELEAERLRPVPPRPAGQSTGPSTADPQAKTVPTPRRTA